MEVLEMNRNTLIGWTGFALFALALVIMLTAVFIMPILNLEFVNPEAGLLASGGCALIATVLGFLVFRTTQGKIASIGGLLLVLLVALVTPMSESWAREHSPPQDVPGFEDSDSVEVQECLDQGGQWEVLGLSGPGCNLPTKDGGKTCSDWANCESLCLADDDTLYNEDETGFLQPDHKIIEQHNAENDQLSGVCSAWQSNFGCHVILENSKYVVICID
jgi:hypothetical protein